MLPLVLLAVPYLATASVGDLYTGLFVTPRGRFESGYYGTAGPVALAFGVVALAVLHALGRSGRGARTTDLVASTAVAALLLVSTATLAGYLTMWYVTTALLPVGVLVGVGALLREDDADAQARQAPLFLLLALTAFVGLVQFPFGAPVYFCFVAPLAVLAWLAMFRDTGLHASVHRIFPTLLLAAIVGFGFVVDHSVLYRDGTRPNGNSQNVSWIGIERGSASARGTEPSTSRR